MSSKSTRSRPTALALALCVSTLVAVACEKDETILSPRRATSMNSTLVPDVPTDVEPGDIDDEDSLVVINSNLALHRTIVAVHSCRGPVSPPSRPLSTRWLARLSAARRVA